MSFASLLSEALDWVGYMGVTLYLASYASLQFGLIRGSGVVYALANLFAASFVLVSLANAFNLSSALIQVFWIVISLVGLIRIVLLARLIRFSPEEQQLIDQAFGDIPKPIARKFLNLGQWIVMQPGAVLLKEGESVDSLFYLSEGQADVTLAGQPLGQVHSGFVGEINVMAGGPASASVQIAVPSTVFLISGTVLRRAAARDGDFRLIIERALSRDLSRKLAQANARLSGAA